MRLSQRLTHFTFPDGSVVPGSGSGSGSVGMVPMGAASTVELGEFVSKHASPRLPFPVTVVSGLVLASLFPVVFWFEAAGWTRKTICVPSRRWTSQSCCVVLFDVGRSRVKD